MATIEEAIEILMRGGVGVLPTDTVYGLVARAGDKRAASRLYTVKHRETKPGTLIAASVEQLADLGLTKSELDRVAHWWPGAVSVVVSAGEELAYLYLSAVGLAVRVPSDPQMHQVLEMTGPLLTTSANQPGEPGAVTLAEAQDYFGEAADFYVVGGNLSGHAPSTLVRVRGDEVEILREGAVNSSELRLRG